MVTEKELTLRCLIKVCHTFVNFRDFSHHYFLIRDRTFIEFNSMISQTKSILLSFKNYSISRVYSLVFFHTVLLFGPIRLLVFQHFPPCTFIRTRTFIRHLRVHIKEETNFLFMLKQILECWSTSRKGPDTARSLLAGQQAQSSSRIFSNELRSKSIL